MNTLPLRRWFPRAGVILASVAALPLAQAHPGHGASDGLIAGLTHPLTGWDHLVAMTALGFWAASQGKKARWVLPAAGLCAMALGALLGHALGPVAATDQGIAASLLVLGLLMAAAVRLPLAVGAAVGGVFTLFHGLAHGAEMPASSHGLTFGLGFLFTSACLLAAGGGLGMVAGKSFRPIPRLAGAAVAVAAVIALARL